MSCRLDGFISGDRHFLDLSEVAAITFGVNEAREQQQFIMIVLKGGFWFEVPRTPENEAAVKSFTNA